MTEQTFPVRDLDDKIMGSTLGGKGLATALLLEHNPAGVDPFESDNHIIIATGPATDSTIYGSCRHGIFCKSPLTSFYGESYSGGSLALPLSRTGFDAVMIKSASSEPVWLEITERGVVFHNAMEIWGRDTFDSEIYIEMDKNRLEKTAALITDNTRRFNIQEVLTPDDDNSGRQGDQRRRYYVLRNRELDAGGTMAAKNINAPNSVIYFETGAIDAKIEELPLAVADPRVMY